MSGLDFPPPTKPPRSIGPATSPPRPSIPAPVAAYANWPQRAGAFLLDGLIGMIATVALYAIAIGLLAGGNGLATAGIILVLVVYLLGPFVAYAFYAWQMCRTGDCNGQTVGKRAVGIRVVRADGLPVSLGTVLMRHTVIGFLYLITLGIGIIVDYLWPLWDERSQSLHDKLAKTYVVSAWGSVPDLSRRSPATPALAPPVGRPRQAPVPLEGPTVVTPVIGDPYGLADPSAAAGSRADAAHTPPTAAFAAIPAGPNTPRHGAGSRGNRPWILAGCLLLALVVAGVGFRLVVNRGAKKLSDAIASSSAATAARSSNSNVSQTPSPDNSPTTGTTTGGSAAGGTTNGSTPAGPTSPSSNNASFPVLSGVTGYIVVRSGPSTSASEVGTLAPTVSVTIVCQSHGDTVTRGTNATDIWDHISHPDGYVTDTVIDTGSSGTVAPDCGTVNAPSGVSNGSPSLSASAAGSTSTPPNGETTRSCDPNISADTGTTCGLAENTFKAYAAAIKSGGADQTVQATGPATGKTYTLTCSSSSGTVSCIGGQTIYITFPSHAAEIY